MRYEWTDGKRALALEDGSLYERGLTVEEAGQEEWLSTDVTRTQGAVFREILRLAARVREMEANAAHDEEETADLEEENRRLREGLGIASSFGGGTTCPDGELHRAKCSRCDAPLRFAPPH